MDLIDISTRKSTGSKFCLRGQFATSGKDVSRKPLNRGLYPEPFLPGPALGHLRLPYLRCIYRLGWLEYHFYTLKSHVIQLSKFLTEDPAACLI